MGGTTATGLADLGPDVGQVDRGRDEGRYRQNADQREAICHTGEADHHSDAEDDEPERLGLLATRDEGAGRPAQRIDECPHLDYEGPDRQHKEQPCERCEGVEGKHSANLPVPAGSQRGQAALISPTVAPPPVTGATASLSRAARSAPGTRPVRAAGPDGPAGSPVSSRSSAMITGSTPRCAPSSILTAPARPSARANAPTPSAPDFVSSPGTAVISAFSGLVLPAVQAG